MLSLSKAMGRDAEGRVQTRAVPAQGEALAGWGCRAPQARRTQRPQRWAGEEEAASVS